MSQYRTDHTCRRMVRYRLPRSTAAIFVGLAKRGLEFGSVWFRHFCHLPPSLNERTSAGWFLCADPRWLIWLFADPSANLCLGRNDLMALVGVTIAITASIAHLEQHPTVSLAGAIDHRDVDLQSFACESSLVTDEFWPIHYRCSTTIVPGISCAC